MKHLHVKKLWALVLAVVLTVTAVGPFRVLAEEERITLSDAPVRVSIVLDGTSTFDMGYRAKDLQAELSAARTYRADIRTQQDAVEKTIENEVLGGEKLEVVWNLTFLLNVISAVVPENKIDAIKALPGVRDVWREQLYIMTDDEVTEKGENPYAYTGTVDPQMLTSGTMIGSYEAYTAGYTGAGSRIAIIDTGIGTNHQSFNAGALEYSLEQNAAEKGMSYDAYKNSLNLLTSSKISSLRSQLNSSGSTSSYTTKIPYGYNYISKSTDISHTNDYAGEHGSHVAGIAAANKYIPDASSETGYSEALKSIYVQGVAPDAQLLIMKVFGLYTSGSTKDYNGGAYDSDYMAAIEDALVLGADAINMSLGSAAPGFSEIKGFTYQSVLDSVEASGTVLSVSNGNAYSWAYYAPENKLYADDVNYSIDGTPGSFRETIGVAAIENVGFVGSYFDIGTVIDVNLDGTMDQEDALDILSYAAGGKGRIDGHLYDWDAADVDGDGQVTSYDAYELLNLEGGARVFFSESTDYGNAPMSTINGERSYILIDGYGTTTEWSALKNVVQGKIAVCSRGSTSFYEKANAAVANGAIGVIIYNNQAGSIGLNLTGYQYTAPVISVHQSVGAYMKASAVRKTSGSYTYYEGSIQVGSDVTVSYGRPSDPYVMCDFSSWGVPGSLELKPEITAPGGNIYSVNGQHVVYSGGDEDFDYSTFKSSDNTVVGSASSYESMSGTSMAAPQVTGMTAVIAQYIRENGLAAATGLTPRVLAHSLLMSTAKPVVNAETGTYYSVMKQGAGLANVGNAIASKSYILMDSGSTVSYADGKVKAELGDDPGRTGNYSYAFTVYNLSDEELTYHLDTELFTQDVETKNAVKYLSDNTRAIGANVSYSTGNSFTLPARGSQKVTVTAQLTSAQKAEFEAASGAYKDAGAYIEGYTRLTSYDEEGVVTDVDHSVVVLGFYGSWTDASMFDRSTYVAYYQNGRKWPAETPYTFETLDSSENVKTLYGLSSTLDMTQYYNNLTYKTRSSGSETPMTGSTIRSTYYLGRFYYRLIRNAGAVVGIIQDANGTILKTTAVKRDLTALFNYYGYFYMLADDNDSTTAYADYFSHYINFNTSISSLGVSNGSKIKVSIVAVPEYYTRGMSSSQITTAWIQNLINSGALGAGAFKTIELTVSSSGSMSDPGEETEDTGSPVETIDRGIIEKLRARRKMSVPAAEEKLPAARTAVEKVLFEDDEKPVLRASGEPLVVDTTDNTVSVSSSISGLTNGKRVITYDPEVLTFASLNGSTEERGSGTLALDTNVLYAYAVDPEAGTVTIAFASKTAASGALPEIIFNYAEEGGVLTAGQTETTVNTQTLEENASLTPQEAEDHEAVLGYTVSAHVDGGLGTTTADTPLSVEKDYAFSVVATLESGHELDHVTLNGTRLTEGVTAENQRVTAAFTVSQDSEIIFYAAGSDTPKVSVSVTKHWEDEEDQDGIRPDSIRVQLYGNGFEVGEPAVLSPDNAWCMTWTDLPAFDNETAIQYTVEELGTVPGYTTSLSGTASTGFILTNTHSVYTTNVTVQKNWSDHENASGVRPSSVTVCLDADNADTGKTLVLTAAGNWTGAFNGLPKRENGRDIQYTIREEQTAGYTSAVTQGIATTFVVTNTINRHTLTFKDGDQVLKESTLDYGEAVTAPEDPQKPFHVFAGWDREVPQTMPDEDLTIYATWNAVEGYYLVGDLNEWQVREEYQFAENPQNAGEYYLAANLSVGTEIKVAYASGGVIQGWYPGTEHNYNGKTDNYTVDTDHSGAVTIYFRPAGNSDSYWQPFGGYFYIEKDHEVNVQVAEGSGDAYVIRNGNHETTFTAPRLMTIEVVASAGTHYELDRVELWKKYGNDGPELERVLDGVNFVMGDYDVIAKVYFKYAAHDLVKTEAKDPTCEEPGNEAYWTCTICGKFFSDEDGKTEIEEGSWVIEAMGHDWDLPIYTWTSDNKKVTASRTCYNDPRHEERETVSATYTLIKEATCEEAGEGRWTSDAFENKAFTVQTKKVTIKALGHDLVKTDAKDPTCTEPGNTAYWTCSRCGKYFSDAEGKTEIEEGSWVIEAMGHDWDAPEYTWSKDYKTVTATRVCYTDRSHKETETVSATFTVTKAATCEESGEGLWTSDTFRNQAFKVQTKKVTIPALGHDWDTPVITWEGYESAKAERSCKRDASHTETVDLEITSEVTKEAAAWEDGVRTYTASGTFKDGTPVRDTKTEAIPAYGWKWTRLKGTNRYGTMATITKEAYPEEEAEKCTTLIVATGESFPDALAGSALAGVYGCPVILTKSAALSPQAESEIRRLMSEEGCTVLILGGDGAVSPEVEEAIKAIDEHIVVERVKGSNRDRTAITVYEKAFKDENGKSVSDTVIITTGYNYADALSISPYAYAAKTPVLLARKDGSLSDEVKTLLTEAGFEKALIVGGNGAVSDETQDYLETTLGIKVMRLSGSNRYKTSAEIIRWELGMKEDALFQPAVLMTNAGMGVATGENFADALASVSLLGKNGSVLLLANGQKLALLQESVDDFIKPYVKEMEKGYIFGGDNAVSPEIESLLNAAIE